MSDFDKEAERERLREKYEQEQQDRQATERMSELLLKGATMTNAHCSDCGDPVFRYEGQEFCATCEKAVDRGDGASPAAPDGSEDTDAAGVEASDNGTRETPADGSEDAEQIHVTSPDETRVQFGGGAGETAESSSPSRRGQTPEEPEPAAGQEPGDRPTQPPAETPGPQSEPETETETETRAPGVEPSSPSSTGAGAGSTARDAGAEQPAGTLPEARHSLERTLAGLTRRAAAAKDPTEAREYLAAAREAAETLAALRQ